MQSNREIIEQLIQFQEATMPDNWYLRNKLKQLEKNETTKQQII